MTCDVFITLAYSKPKDLIWVSIWIENQPNEIGYLKRDIAIVRLISFTPRGYHLSNR